MLTSHPAYPTRRQLRREARAEAIVASHRAAMLRLAEILGAAALEIEMLDLRIGPRGYGREDILGAVTDIREAARRGRQPYDLETIAWDLVENEGDV